MLEAVNFCKEDGNSQLNKGVMGWHGGISGYSRKVDYTYRVKERDILSIFWFTTQTATVTGADLI